jgi:hypothetical protein
MNNYKLSLIALLLIISSGANAQFKFGLGGGVNLANVSGDISNNESLTGFNGGIMMEIKLPVKIGIEADVLYSLKGSSLGGNDMKLSYIDIPLVLKIYSLKVISFQLGPQYSVLASATYDGNDIKELYESSDISAVAGIGVDVSKLHVSARYNFGLTSIDATGGNLKNNMLTLSVGLWLKK